MDQYLEETHEHVDAVKTWMEKAIRNLNLRARMHDASKFRDPEMSGFMAMTADSRLKDLTYGSEEYRAVLREHKPTIQRHYEENDHHPEHTGEGIAGMSLMALLEMLCDWKASTTRMKDGDLADSILKNQARFGYSDEIRDILIVTSYELGMF